MGGAFIITCVAGALLVFLPGLFIMKSLRFSWAEGLVAAPPLSAAVITVAGVACHGAGLDGAFALIGCTVVLCALLCAGALGLGRLRTRRLVGAPARIAAGPSAISWGLIAVYAVVNVSMMTYLYLWCIGSPEAVISFGDNDYHLAVVKSMMDSGNFSTLSVSAYPDTLNSTEIPLAANGYYPAGWHAVTALMGVLTGASAMLAENASLFLFCALVFPFGVLAVLGFVFPQRPRLVFWGSFAACACVAFPLRPLLVHQIYPTVAGFACVLSVAALLFVAARPATTQRRGAFAAFLLGIIGLGVLHPGAVFACGVFLFAIVATVLIPQVASMIQKRRGGRSSQASLVAVLVGGWTILAVALWLFVLELPAFYATTHFLWTWTVSAKDAFVSVLTLGLCLMVAQYALAIMVWVGFAWCCCHREGAWLALAAALCCLIFFANAAGDPTIKRLFAGFWYTDPERTAALVAIGIAPLTAIGLYEAAHFVRWVITRLSRRRSLDQGGDVSRVVHLVAAIIVLAVFLPLNYLSSFIAVPLSGFYGASGFSITRHALRAEADPNTVLIYDADEMAFVDEVKEVLGDEADELVLNMPYDGSLYTYPVDDLNVYYKSHIEAGQDTEASELIRKNLDDVTADDAVRDAVEESGARYVLKLYQNPDSNFDRNQWKPEEWTGFDELTDETPGFEVVLSDGDMRLYRITALD